MKRTLSDRLWHTAVLSAVYLPFLFWLLLMVFVTSLIGLTTSLLDIWAPRR